MSEISIIVQNLMKPLPAVRQPFNLDSSKIWNDKITFHRKIDFYSFHTFIFSPLSSSLYPSLAHPFQFNLPYSVCYLKNNNKIRSTEQDVHEMKINKWLCIRKLFGCTSCHALWNSSSHFIRFIFAIHKSDFCHDSVTDNLLLCVIKKQR